jgi:hypothetical protein
MALSKSIARSDNKVKFPFTSSYHKINSIKMENGKIQINVKGYADAEARQLDTPSSSPMPSPMDQTVAILEKTYSLDMSLLPSATLKTLNEADRIKHCCYIYLRAQDDYRTASDVFEANQNVPL